MKVTDEMVSRFLCWRLPDTFAPDGGISFRPIERHPDWTHDSWPVGTNLFTAAEARAMLEYVLSEASQPPARPEDDCAECDGTLDGCPSCASLRERAAHQPTAYCRYCGVPDGDGHNAACVALVGRR